MPKFHKQGVYRKLIRVFATQIILISAATFLGVYFSAKIVENVLVKKALQGEAEHFWALYQKNPNFPKPNTLNLLGFLAVNGDVSSVPDVLRMLEPGYGRAELDGNYPIVYVSDYQDSRLYLVFDEVQVSKLALYFGVAPLSIVLLVLYLVTWLTYRQSRKAISPLVKLADVVAGFDVQTMQLREFDLSEVRKLADDSDAIVLIDALEQFTNRLQSFVEREQRFTRDASHELRTPLAVIKGSFDLLNKNPQLAESDLKALKRIERTVNNMEALLDTLLMLSREEYSKLQSQAIVINDVVAELLEQIKSISGNKDIQTGIEHLGLLQVNVSEKILVILFGNILRNAFNYTQQGKVTVRIKSNRSVEIIDSGIGMDDKQLANAFKPFYRANEADQSGYGIGLSIVSRICERFAWRVQAVSNQGGGTVITITFPDAQVIGSVAAKG